MLHHMLRAAAQRAFSVLDPYFQYVTMLLHGDGTNGAQNNTFLDSSTNNFTITRNGNTTQGTFTPYGSNWSNYFDGSGDYLTTPSNAALNLSTGDWTIELWVYLTTTYDSYYGGHLIGGADENTGGGGWSICLRSGHIVLLGNSNSQGDYNVNFQLNTWNHIALVRSGTGANSVSLYFNGVPYTATGNGANNPTFGNSNGPIYIGEHPSYSATAVTGYISNARVVKGTAVYPINQSSITVPTAPLTAVSGTSLLTCQSNRFIDNSTNNFTITVNGNTSVQRFSPFSPTTAYSTSVIGGSGYFDGTGDYLQIPQNDANVITGSGTVEAWIYLTSYNTTDAYATSSIVYNSNGANASTIAWTGFGVYGNYLQGALTFYNYVNGEEVTSADGLIKLNTWYHVAAVRSSDVMTLYVNGVSVASGAMTGNLFNNNSGWYFQIGHWQYLGGNNRYFKGYMTDLRIVNGTAVYTSAFTPPTAPLTAITNTSLLLNYTNAGILDNAMMNDLETVGNAQISTSVKKYGTGSMYFDGTGDWLVTPYNPNWILSGDFTIELWLYWTAHGSYGGIVGCANSNTGSAISAGWFLDFNSSSNNLQFEGQGGVSVVTTNVIPSSQWVHIAVVRSGSTITHYLNGVANGSGTSSTSFNSSTFPLYVGVDRGGSSTLTGYIDDLRITKGVARYTTTFTPPTAAFPNN